MNNSKCPICESSQLTKKYTLKNDVYECSNCHFQFCNNAVFDASFFSSLDESEREKALKGLRKANFKRIVSSIKQLNPKASGIEIGCGYGWFLETCKEHEIECEGVEPETRFNDLYKVGSFLVRNGFYPDIITESDKYDFIIFNDVLEHIPEIDATMKANFSILNYGGLLIVNIPVQEGLFYFFSRMAYNLGFTDLLNRMWQFNFHSPHIFYFRKGNLVKLASKYNFHLIESYKLKTIKFSEISNRIKSDQNQGFMKYLISLLGSIILYPFSNIYPDIYCFIFKKDD